jgi:hypothetical protein
MLLQPDQCAEDSPHGSCACGPVISCSGDDVLPLTERGDSSVDTPRIDLKGEDCRLWSKVFLDPHEGGGLSKVTRWWESQTDLGRSRECQQKGWTFAGKSLVNAVFTSGPRTRQPSTPG